MSVITDTVTPLRLSVVPDVKPQAPDTLAVDDSGRSPWMSAAREVRDGYLRRYHRHEVDVDAPVPDRPVLLVSNHGFGGVVDLNVLAAARALRTAGVQRPTTALVHQMAWSLGAGPLVKAIGGRPANKDNAHAAFDAGHNVFVFPGGDLDAGKAWRDRDRILFANRYGFARLAIDRRVPIVPIVTAGAGESLLVLTDGRKLARTLRLPKLLRLKTLPVSIAMGWGLNVGVAGMLPYAPMSTKLHTAVMRPMIPADGESADELATRVHAAMQARLDGLVAGRRPVLG